MLLNRKQPKNGVTQDRIHRSHQDVPTRWRSKLGSMLSYTTFTDHIDSAFNGLDIDRDIFNAFLMINKPHGRIYISAL